MCLIILASKSPRRIKLLKEVGIDLIVVVSNVDESLDQIIDPIKFVKEISRAKVLSVLEKVKEKKLPVLGADTIVVLGKKILGKPKNKRDAFKMLKMISGKKHIVYTGFSIWFPKIKKIKTSYVKSFVKIKKLTDKEIAGYLKTGEPFDKAGSYAIQGIGQFMVKEVHGSYTNVVGLPVVEVLECLGKFGNINILKNKNENSSKHTKNKRKNY